MITDAKSIAAIRTTYSIANTTAKEARLAYLKAQEKADNAKRESDWAELHLSDVVETARREGVDLDPESLFADAEVNALRNSVRAGEVSIDVRTGVVG